MAAEWETCQKCEPYDVIEELFACNALALFQTHHIRSHRPFGLRCSLDFARAEAATLAQRLASQNNSDDLGHILHLQECSFTQVRGLFLMVNK